MQPRSHENTKDARRRHSDGCLLHGPRGFVARSLPSRRARRSVAESDGYRILLRGLRGFVAKSLPSGQRAAIFEGSQGYTFIELLVVATIVLILASAILP